MLRPTTDFADLCFHALAHVPLPPPGDLYDLRYVEWAGEALDAEAVAPFVEDAEVISRACAASPERAIGLSALPILFGSVDAFLRRARAPFGELGLDADCHAGALTALRSADPAVVEILWADLALAARAYLVGWERVVGPEVERGLARVRPHLERASAVRGAVDELRVEAAHALGGRGRALGGRILVGVPAAFCEELDPAIPAVVALHEDAVEAAGRGVRAGDAIERWARAEWAALTAVARRLEGGDRALARAHGEWLAALSLDGLLREVSRWGLCSEALAARLRGEPEGRAGALAEAGDATPAVG